MGRVGTGGGGDEAQRRGTPRLNGHSHIRPGKTNEAFNPSASPAGAMGALLPRSKLPDQTDARFRRPQRCGAEVLYCTWLSATPNIAVFIHQTITKCVQSLPLSFF